jgi:hypothetical protein
MTLQRIFDRYNANNDAGPVTWADIALANEVRELRSEIEHLKAAPAAVALHAPGPIEQQLDNCARELRKRSKALNGLSEAMLAIAETVGLNYMTVTNDEIVEAVKALAADRDRQKRRGDHFWRMYAAAANDLETEREARQEMETIISDLCNRLGEMVEN